MLATIDHAESIDPYTVFFRADIEAMTGFHRTGKEPRWPDFFAEGTRRSRGERLRIEPFRPKPVTRFGLSDRKLGGASGARLKKGGSKEQDPPYSARFD